MTLNNYTAPAARPKQRVMARILSIKINETESAAIYRFVFDNALIQTDHRAIKQAILQT